MNQDDRLTEIAARLFRVDAALIPPSLAIGDLPEWDSLGQLLLLTEVEREFDVRFDGEQLVSLSSLDLIRRELERRSAES